MQRIFLSSWCLGALVVVFSPAQAMEWTLHGAVKNETAYFTSGNKRLDKIQNRLELKPEAVIGSQWEFRSRFLGWYDAAMDVYADNTTDLTPGIKRHYRTYLASKEAYLMYMADSFDFRLGQQQIVWGETDGLRLLDIINPLDQREFILDDFLDSRIGLWAARLNYYADLNGVEHEFEFVLTPDARPAKFAPSGSRWAYAQSLPTGATSQRLLASKEPGWALGNMEYGFAWRSNLDGWDLSLNYFYGWRDTPNLSSQLEGTVLVTQARHLRMHTVGGSFANAFGALVLRGEAAVNLREGIDTNVLSYTASVVRKTTVNAALVAEYTKNNWVISSQVFIRHIAGAGGGSLTEDETSGFVTLRVATDFMNEKLKPEVLLLADWADGGWLMRPKASYEFSDAWVGTLGADIFAGSAGFFGQFAANDRIYTEIEWSF